MKINSFAAFGLWLSLATVGTILSAQPASEATLYYFTNPACGPCRAVTPEVETLYRHGYAVKKIDTSLHPDWTQHFQVDRTPTVVLVSNNQVIARHSGYIDAATMENWFRQLAEKQVGTRPKSTATAPRMPQWPGQSNATTQGTYQPADQAERLALQATVRLKVDDPQGTSYATGTVIHSVKNESLVLTCGHVFRESQGTGAITAEYGFAENDVDTAIGELLFYDADDRDVALVAISTKRHITPATLASSESIVHPKTKIFSIGCDHGDRPSIRRSQVKRTAKYNGVNKIEILGRPAIGRSGGGMFTKDGQLIGVCNAAVVDDDEGVYVALDSIYWQLDQINLAHLFQQPKHQQPRSDNAIAAADRPRNLIPSNRLAQIDSTVRPRLSTPTAPVRRPKTGFGFSPNLVANQQAGSQKGDMELIVVLRDRNRTTGQSQSWTIENPSQDMIQKLKAMSRNDYNGIAAAQTQENRIADLRSSMPNLQNASGKNYSATQIRAQSPR